MWACFELNTSTTAWRLSFVSPVRLGSWKTETSRLSLWIIRGKQFGCSQTFQQLCNGSLVADACDCVARKLTMLECTDDKINEWIIFLNRLLWLTVIKLWESAEHIPWVAKKRIVSSKQQRKDIEFLCSYSEKLKWCIKEMLSAMIAM